MLIGQSLQPLSAKEQALFLALVLFGCKKQEELLRFLPDDDATPVREKLPLLQNINRKERVSIALVRLKQLLSLEKKSVLLYVHQTWILDELHNEPPYIAKLLLGKMPASVRSEFPAQDVIVGDDEKLTALALKNFAAKFESHIRPEFFGTLKLEHLLLFEEKELVGLLELIGAQEIANVFYTVGIENSAKVIRLLGKSAGDALLHSIKAIHPTRTLDLSYSNLLIGSVSSAFGNALQLAGLFFLATIIGLDEENLTKAIAQKLPKPIGLKFFSFAQYPKFLSRRDEFLRSDVLLASHSTLFVKSPMR